MLGDGIVSFGVWPSSTDATAGTRSVAEDRLARAERAVDVQRGRRELDVALGVVELDLSCRRRPS
jgi:hypothetical protein